MYYSWVAPNMALLFVAIAIVFRLYMLAVSSRNEKVLRADGAREVGTANSRLLAVSHVAFYVSAIVEAGLNDRFSGPINVLGVSVYLFGAAMLIGVAGLLGRFWTVKLLIARDHVLITHPLFRTVRHPNYFLNILPELVGFALTLHAYLTMIIGLSLYVIPLWIRIRQEEAAMQNEFPDYRN